MTDIPRKRLYFGHPINIYDTDFEVRLLERISRAFVDWDIENPNQKRHSEGYEHWKRTTDNGMNYFFMKVLRDCHGGIFLPFRDGAWGAGTFGEARFLSGRGLPIWMITPDGAIEQINIDSIRVLTVEETRTRIRTASGETVPY